VSTKPGAGHSFILLSEMSKGKAASIRLTRLERRALENYFIKLENHSDERGRYLAKYHKLNGKKGWYSDRHYMPIIKLKAILLAADGLTNKEISNKLEISQHTVGEWRNDFAYVLSRTDLPFERIKDFFLYTSGYDYSNA
jgi:hypothetical protein